MMSSETPVIIYYLEMLSRDWQVPAPATPAPELRQVHEPCPALNRFFYGEVGRHWRWTDRRDWSDERWMLWLDRPEQQTWIALLDGNPIGYAELDRQGRDVQLAYFGLLPQFVGRGLGGAMLAEVVARAWLGDSARLWVHTCSLDHPSALRNYERRGFRIYKQRIYKQRTAGGDNPVQSG